MVTWNEAKEWFADHSEQVTLAIGHWWHRRSIELGWHSIGIALRFSMACYHF